MLSNSVDLKEKISVLVGKNGAGKTRFFQSITSGHTVVTIDGTKLNPQEDIVLLTTSSLTPNFSTVHNPTTHDEMIRSTVTAYKQSKSTFSSPFVSDASSNGLVPMGRGMYPRLDPRRLHEMITRIAKRLDKDTDALTDNDILLHFELPQNAIFEGHQIASIFNTYVKRLRDNDYCKFLIDRGRDGLTSYTMAEFVHQFGAPPWQALNKILTSVFDGKFYFPQPDLESITDDHPTPLLDLNGRKVDVNELSSGEKTLLWLSFSLFNAQYSPTKFNSTPKLLLLDEPDAFLHPKLVEKLFLALNEINIAFGTNVVLITHSPTTVAMASEKSIFLVSESKIDHIDKDAAISELLDGVSQISIDPEKRRQVFVESFYDRDMLQLLFDHRKSRSNKINPKISIIFVPSGPKIPGDYLKQKVKNILNIHDSKLINTFIEAVNGGGNCSQVYGIVESLNLGISSNVRGLVDWDLKNDDKNGVKVFGRNYVYSIENAILDPIATLLLAHLLDAKKYSISLFCGIDLPWNEWISNIPALQNSLDFFINKVMGFANSRDAELSYVSEITIQTDKRYLNYHGHSLEKIVYKEFPEFERIARSNRDGELKYKIVQQSMISAAGGRLIPSFIDLEFARLQL